MGRALRMESTAGLKLNNKGLNMKKRLKKRLKELLCKELDGLESICIISLPQISSFLASDTGESLYKNQEIFDEIATELEAAEYIRRHGHGRRLVFTKGVKFDNWLELTSSNNERRQNTACL